MNNTIPTKASKKTSGAPEESPIMLVGFGILEILQSRKPND